MVNVFFSLDTGQWWFNLNSCPRPPSDYIFKKHRLFYSAAAGGTCSSVGRISKQLTWHCLSSQWLSNWLWLSPGKERKKYRKVTESTSQVNINAKSECTALLPRSIKPKAIGLSCEYFIRWISSQILIQSIWWNILSDFFSVLNLKKKKKELKSEQLYWVTSLDDFGSLWGSWKEES